jgi:hypothetical protein
VRIRARYPRPGNRHERQRQLSGLLAKDNVTRAGNSGVASELRDRARANTERFVTNLYTSMGYDHVMVVFDQPSPRAAA